MNKLERWTQTINEFTARPGSGYLCWCPISRGENLRSCLLYKIGIDVDKYSLRVRLYFAPEDAKEAKDNRIFIFDFRPAEHLAVSLIDTRRDKMNTAEQIARVETGKFFRTNGLQPIEGVSELVEAITARTYYFNQWG